MIIQSDKKSSWLRKHTKVSFGIHFFWKQIISGWFCFRVFLLELCWNDLQWQVTTPLESCDRMQPGSRFYRWKVMGNALVTMVVSILIHCLMSLITGWWGVALQENSWKLHIWRGHLKSKRIIGNLFGIPMVFVRFFAVWVLHHWAKAVKAGFRTFLGPLALVCTMFEHLSC